MHDMQKFILKFGNNPAHICKSDLNNFFFEETAKFQNKFDVRILFNTATRSKNDLNATFYGKCLFQREIIDVLVKRYHLCTNDVLFCKKHLYHK